MSAPLPSGPPPRPDWIRIRRPNAAAAIAIWNTQVVTWEEGVIDVFGVMSICCEKAVPAGRPSDRTEMAPTQQTLKITCRAR